MKILVPTKRVPDTDQKIEVAPDGSRILEEHLPFIISPFDAIALEEAVRIRESGVEAEILAVGIGGEAYEEQLRTALAMGADRALRVACDQPLDSWNVAGVLAALVARETPQLVLMGKQAVDDDCNQAGQFLAVRLDWPQATFASRVELLDDRVRVDRETDVGVEVIETSLPAVVTVDLRLNEPRYASLPSIMKARKKTIEETTLAELGVELSAKVETLGVRAEASVRKRERVASVEQLVDQILRCRRRPVTFFDTDCSPMQILVYAEHDGCRVRPASLSALGMAQQVAEQLGASAPRWLLAGADLRDVAEHAAQYAAVELVESPRLQSVVAENFAHALAYAVKSTSADLLVAPSSAHGKDVVTRAAGMLGGAMASDVIGHSVVDGQLRWERPIFAGAAIAEVTLHGTPQVVTVRGSAYGEAPRRDAPGEVSPIALDESLLTDRVRVIEVRSTDSRRPDVTEAKVVVSGGRAIKNSDDFERLVGGLADALEGAAGSSRALVDAGIAPNELQVGQTGKVVAPQLYIALGISGAVQHLAGMKNSRTVIAVNNDPEAPIFDEADYGFVGDIYELTPQLINQLQTVDAVDGH